MRRTLGSLGAVLLLAIAVSATASESASAASPRTFQYDSLGRLTSVSAANANTESGRLRFALGLDGAGGPRD
jgi:YD repeat-containing protein